ncbi:MAG: hypothetical protein JW847_00035 [Candidatus Omnitrophica bacterium]|nr:hypothetical protein [Candidatus Omnitrophota bacterium]
MPKPPGRLRILAVGDSFTYGVGAEDNETIPARIEQALQQQNRDVEVINAGIGHTSPITHYVNIRDLHLNYQPDLVLLLFDLTDLWDDWSSQRNAVLDKNGEIIRFDPTFIYGKRDWWRTCCLYSAFCKYMNNKVIRSFKKIQLIGFRKYLWLSIQGKRAKAEIINSGKVQSEDAKIEYDGMLMLRGREKQELIEKNWARTAAYLTKIRDLLAQHNIPMILVMYPHGIYVGEDQWNDGREPWGFEKNKLYTDLYPFELVKQYAQKSGIPFINTLDHFFEVETQDFFYSYDGHMTPAGYRVVAEGITENETFQSAVSNLISKK